MCSTHPGTRLIQPANVRASSTPSSSPIITVPIARPRSFSATMSGAMGSAMCVTEARLPSSTLAAIRHARFGEAATINSATDTAAYMRSIEPSRRSSDVAQRNEEQQPPQHIPTCGSHCHEPDMRNATRRLCAISASSGWL